jgi:integral membrane protein
MKGISGALLRFRIMAWITGVVLATGTVWMIVLIIGWMGDGGTFASFFTTNETKPGLYSILWIGHGWLYFIYLITAVDLCFRMKLVLWKTLLMLLAGTVPFMSFVADAWVHRYVRANAPEGVSGRTASP